MQACRQCKEPAETQESLCYVCTEDNAIESEHVNGEHDKRMRFDCFYCIRRVL